MTRPPSCKMDADPPAIIALISLMRFDVRLAAPIAQWWCKQPGGTRRNEQEEPLVWAAAFVDGTIPPISRKRGYAARALLVSEAQTAGQLLAAGPQ